MVTNGDKISFKNPTWVRQDKSLDSKRIDILKPGEDFTVTDVDGDWIRSDKGWSMFLQNNIVSFAATPQASTQPKNTDDKKKKEDDEWWAFTTVTNENKDTSDGQILKNANGVFGLPYQYLPSVDTRLPGTIFGRTYADKIISRMPLLLMSPGKPNFMGDYSNSEKKSFLTSLIGGDGHAGDMMNSKDGQLYTFEYNYKPYYKTVNSMCSTVSRLLGVDSYQLYGKQLGTFKWDQYANPQLTNFIQCAESVAFYVDAETQIGETFTNTTKDSMLSSTINSVSEMGQELQFLLGGASGATGAQFDKLKAENYDATMEEINKFTEKYTSILPKNLVDTLSQSLTTVIGGGKMAFPEIWSDSSISRGYDISIKLRTPDCDSLSWFLNIAVPMIHLIAFVAPQQMGPNSYRSPFLVRAYYKGIFNCQMGIITNMSIQRGDKARWTLNGLPTEVNINFSLKDLYDYLNISTFSNSIVDMFKNTVLVDYLATLCGININKPDILRTIDLYKLSIENKATDLITFNRFLGVKQTISNIANRLF